jgi:hypothetical protein
MRRTKVVESVDIEAPRDEVFDIVASFDRRLQLSPLWGVAEIQNVTPEFPQEGSYYHTKLVEGDEEYDTIVTAYEPTQKFAYRLTSHRQTHVTWTFQDLPQGTRLIYHEEFLVDEAGDDEFVQSVRGIVQEWLNNTKRYAELGHRWWGRRARWGVDRFLLPLKVKQRRVIFILLAWEAVGCLSFIALGLGWGLAKLLGLM